MIDFISIGSLTLDLFFQDESLTIQKDRFYLAIGGKYVVEKFVEGVGGGGGNIAVGVSRAGKKAAVWGQLGQGGVSKLIKERLLAEKVDCTLLEGHDAFTNISTVLLSPKGERTIVNHRSHAVNLTLSAERKAAIASARLLYLGNMPELSLEFRAEILHHAHGNNVKTALNLGVKDCRQGKKALSILFEDSDFIIINRHELADILSVPANELLLAEVNYHEELGVTEDAVVVITDGEYGSFAYTKQGIMKQDIVPVTQVIDTTGAGDAFTSGFLVSQLYNKSLQESLLAGARNSASIIQVINAQSALLTEKELFD
ncbi:MAG: carbohydrate kinase family protein [Patescibacteria group bacterium]|jgi:sugar/nucleoside kinase (ribokinase family)